jgi:hypothetical protein
MRFKLRYVSFTTSPNLIVVRTAPFSMTMVQATYYYISRLLLVDGRCQINAVNKV